MGGFDVAFGIAALALVSSALNPHFGADAARVGGALAFGLGFVFVIVGKSELFTENFLVPIAGLEPNRRSWLKLGELWLGTLVLNVVGGVLVAIVLTAEGVMPGTSGQLVAIADRIAGLSTLSAFASGIVAGALMTLMTWFVEGAAPTSGVRIVMAWVVGFLVAVGSFNHAIVSTLELVFGLRYGADVGLGQLAGSLAVAVAGNLVGGLLLVTFTRVVQAAALDGD